MSAISNYLENKILDHVLGKGARNLASPSSLYVALFTDTATPSDNGPANEVSGGAYARQSVSFNTATNGSTGNTGEVTFPVATASWGNVSYVAIYDSASTGNCLFYGALTTPKAIAQNDQFKILAGDLTITLN
jgi:hypothetical protein